MRRAVVMVALVGGLIGASAPAALAGKGVFTIEPPGRGGEATATCVGPEWAKSGAIGKMSAWNAHFNGRAVTHDFGCDH